MTTSHSPSTTATHTAVRRPRRRRPRPFPVIITQPATATVAPLTAIQRERRRIADQGGAELTVAARWGRRPHLDHPHAAPISDFPEASRIIATAAALAANPDPGALRVGRDLRGRSVAVVLHAEHWSLLIRPSRVGYAPTSWTFFDPHPDYLDAITVGSLVDSGFRFDHDSSVAGVEWNRMLVAVLKCAA